MRIKYKKYVYTSSEEDDVRSKQVVFDHLISLCDLRIAYIKCPHIVYIGEGALGVLKDEYRWCVIRALRYGYDCDKGVLVNHEDKV